MSRLPAFPKIDLTSFDLAKLPSFDLPTFELPRVEFGDLDDKVAATVKNAAYLAVGLGVTAFERLDQARRTANSAASDALDSLSAALSGVVGRVGKLDS